MVENSIVKLQNIYIQASLSGVIILTFKHFKTRSVLLNAKGSFGKKVAAECEKILKKKKAGVSSNVSKKNQEKVYREKNQSRAFSSVS
jgi:hypothetical protein